MANFATVEQLESRWRPLTTTENTRAAVLLGDASAQLRVECPDIDRRIIDGELDAVISERVVCDMVKRAMLSADTAGVKSIQEGAGPFQTTMQYTNPTGDLYLTKAERKLLGCGAQEAFTVPFTPRDEVAPWLTWMP